MPLYDYDCAACGRRIEVVHGVHSPGPTHCPNCGGGPLRKAITAPAVPFKGSGWAKKERRAPVSAGAGKAGETDAATDAPTTDAETSSKKADGDDGGSAGKATVEKASTTSGSGSSTKGGG